MTRLSAICLLASAICLPAYALTDAWNVDVRQHTAVDRTYKQAETVDLRVTLLNGFAPLDLTGATARFYWYTNSVDNVWWTNSAAIPTPKAGLVTASWTPAMDTGAASYAYWVGVWMPGATSPLWRVTGTIRLLSSPGFVPNVLPLPVRMLDFAGITVSNAPWALDSDLQAASNALASAVQELAASSTNSYVRAAESNGAHILYIVTP